MRVGRNVCLLIGGNSVKYTEAKATKGKASFDVEAGWSYFYDSRRDFSMSGGTCGDNRFGGFPFGWFGALSTLGRPLQLSPSNLLTDVFANPSLWKLHLRDDNPWRCFNQLGLRIF